MRKQPKVFAGTCHRCGEVGHKARDCRRSVDLPKCSTKEAATTIVSQMKTWGHNPCYNPKEKSLRGSECESVVEGAVAQVCDFDPRKTCLAELGGVGKERKCRGSSGQEN